MATETEAREMAAKIDEFRLKDAAAEKIRHDRLIARAQAWFDSLPEINHAPTTRDQALKNYDTILSLLKLETNTQKTQVLNMEYSKANEVYKNLKKVGV